VPAYMRKRIFTPNSKKKIPISLLHLLVFLFYLCHPSFTFAQIESLTLFTGSQLGTYFSVGKTIKEIIEKENPKFQILCEPSNGSLANARLIESNKADLAIMQSDIAYYLSTGTRIFSLPSDRINGICSLYSEAIHIVAKKTSGIKTIKDLKGKIISVVQRKSGSEFNTRIILDALDITYQDIVPMYENSDSSIKLLEKNRIDAFFVTTKVHAPYLIKSFEELNLALISFKPSELEKIIKAYPYFVSKVIAANSYANQWEEVSTLGVRALLVANSKVKFKTLYKITESLFRNKEKIKEEHPFISLDAKLSVNVMPIPLHHGAKKYYIDIGIIEKPSLLFYLKFVFLIFLIAFIFFILLKKFPKITYAFLKNFYVRFLIFLTILIFLGAIGLFFLEKRINENFVSISQSFWSCIVYVFSGFENRAPITSIGKAISILIFIIGVSVFGIISGRFAAFFVENALKKEKTMPKNLKGHIAICNWNDRGDTIIKELYSADPLVEITILTDADIRNEAELLKNKEYLNVHLARGDPAIHDRLETSKIHSAKSVIILANEASHDPDAQSALIALAISKVNTSSLRRRRE
jgi:TRAP transporter TAXI family solute receptor